jgi:ATHILA ORF-1 family
MPVKRTSAGPKGAAKKRKGSSSSAPDIDHEMDELDFSNTPQEQWPENNLPYRGIKWAARASQCSKNFDLFQKRKFVPSRYLDDVTMRTLGIYDEVKLLLSGIGLWDVLHTEELCYKTLTLEFLSSFEWDETKDEMSIQFQLDGKLFNLNEDDVCTALSVPFEDDMYLKVDWEYGVSQAEFETQLCEAPQMTMMASQIQHPALKYIQRVLAQSIMGRGETSSKMSMKDLFFLYCMLYNWKHPSLRPHVAFFVMNNLAKIAKNPKAAGTISIGG